MAHRALLGIKLGRKLPNHFKKYVPYKNLLVLDFEATCEKGAILEPQEIIEFPCLALSTDDWQVKDAFHEYVKPRVNPILSPFCTELTGIMQETVDNEQHFPEVFEKFKKWIEEGEYFNEKHKSVFVTCGHWDLKLMLPSQCELENLEVPSYFKEWVELKTTFCNTTNRYPRSLKAMVNYLKMPYHGNPHCGIDDVHNMVRVIQVLGSKYKAEFKLPEKIEFGEELEQE